MGHICVNRSGRTLPVYESTECKVVITNLTPNKVFAWTAAFAGNHTGIDLHQITVWDNGKKYEGWVGGVTSSGGLTPITACCLYKADIDGKSISVFTTKRQVACYNADGSFRKIIPANYFIGVKDGACGASHRDFMYAEYYGYSGVDNLDGYIDLGIELNMSFEALPINGVLR